MFEVIWWFSCSSFQRSGTSGKQHSYPIILIKAYPYHKAYQSTSSSWQVSIFSRRNSRTEVLTYLVFLVPVLHTTFLCFCHTASIDLISGIYTVVLPCLPSKTLSTSFWTFSSSLWDLLVFFGLLFLACNFCFLEFFDQFCTFVLLPQVIASWTAYLSVAQALDIKTELWGFILTPINGHVWVQKQSKWVSTVLDQYKHRCTGSRVLEPKTELLC